MRSRQRLNRVLELSSTAVLLVLVACTSGDGTPGAGGSTTAARPR